MYRQIILFFILEAAFISGSSICSSPQVDPKIYLTSDGQISSGTVFVVEFELKCSNGAKDVNLHAEFHGKTFPVTILSDQNKYQVSISDDHKKLLKGDYQVRIFDDESYSELRKVQRTGGDATTVKSLTVIDISHRGTSRGLWIQTELIAVAGVSLVCYIAQSIRNNLQN